MKIACRQVRDAASFIAYHGPPVACHQSLSQSCCAFKCVFEGILHIFSLVLSKLDVSILLQWNQIYIIQPLMGTELCP